MENEEQAPLPKEVKPKSKTLIWLLLILAVLILAGGGFFVAQWYNQRSEKDSSENQVITTRGERASSPSAQTATPSATPSLSPSPTADEYAGCWNTYTNSTIGYSLKYPCDWTTKEVALYSETIGQNVKYITITTPDEKYFLHVGVKKPTDTFEISDRTGVGAGEMQEKPEDALTILGINVTPKVLIFESKIKEYFYNQPAGTSAECGCNFVGGLSYTDKIAYDVLDMTNLEAQSTAEKILKSVKLL